jgi:hypothetical protein
VDCEITTVIKKASWLLRAAALLLSAALMTAACEPPAPAPKPGDRQKPQEDPRKAVAAVGHATVENTIKHRL